MPLERGIQPPIRVQLHVVGEIVVVVGLQTFFFPSAITRQGAEEDAPCP